MVSQNQKISSSMNSKFVQKVAYQIERENQEREAKKISKRKRRESFRGKVKKGQKNEKE